MKVQGDKMSVFQKTAFLVEQLKIKEGTVVGRGDKIDFDFLTFLTDLQSIIILMKGFTMLAFFALFIEKNDMSKMSLLSISPKVSHFAS